MKKLTISKPSEKQLQFLREQHRYIGYGGARGGGKSWAVRVKAVLLCLNYPGIKTMIIRKSYPELQENHIVPLCEMLHCYDADKSKRLAAYNGQQKKISFPNGSRIIFRYCENDQDAMKFQGLEVDVLFIDEATQQSEYRMEIFKACVRGVNGFPKRSYYTCNPGGEGHEWMKRLFIERQYKDEENPAEYVFIKALVTDNYALMRDDPGYKKSLESLPPKIRAAWLNGDWDVYEGQFFEDFCRSADVDTAKERGCLLTAEELRAQHRWCHVIPPMDLTVGERRGWAIYRSYDFGYGKPFSCAWWAVDYDGVLYRIMEMYGCTEVPNEGLRWTPDQQFNEIARTEREHPWLKGKRIEGVADPSIWDASRGESVAETAARYGVYFVPGDNRRIPGWMQCHYRLQFDSEGYSRMYVFENCKAFIRTVPMLRYSNTRVEDLDTDGEDHVADEWRYMCMTRPVIPMRERVRKSILSDPLDQFKKTGGQYGHR